MITKILIITGILYFIDKMFEKFMIWNSIEKSGSNSKFKIVYELTQCRFCMMFHLSIILTILCGIANGFSIDLSIVPFVVGGITQIIEKK